MTDEECTAIISKAIHHLVRCYLDDGALAFEEIKESFRKAIRGLKWVI